MCNTSPPGKPGEAHDRFAEAAAFHGHVCPGLATGYRAAEIALSRLRSGHSEDEELVTIAETDACGVDAIQVLTGCTAGKGNLLFKDYGKHAFTFINRKTGAAVRVAANPSFDVDSLDPCLAPLPERARIFSSVPCSKCGEMTAESRVRLEDGKFVCYACRKEYSRRG